MTTTLSVLLIGEEGPVSEALLDQLSCVPEVATLEHAGDTGGALEAFDADRFDVVLLDAALCRRPDFSWEPISGRLADATRLLVYLAGPVRAEQLREVLLSLGPATADPEGPDPAPTISGIDQTLGWAPLRSRIPALFRGQLRLFPIDSVHMATFLDRRVVVRTAEGAFPCPLGMAELQERVRGRSFLQVHRRYVVNLDHVQSIQTQVNGGYLLKVGSGASEFPVPVSRRRAVELRQELRI